MRTNFSAVHRGSNVPLKAHPYFTNLCLNVPLLPDSLGSASPVATELLTVEVVPESLSVPFPTAVLKVSEYKSLPTSSWMSLRSFLPNVTQATKQKKLYKHYNRKEK